MGTTQNNVVIAGVGPGLGAALARKFANHGCNIGLLARNESYLDQLVDQMATINLATRWPPLIWPPNGQIYGGHLVHKLSSPSWSNSHRLCI